jgi:hypothetical protein
MQYYWRRKKDAECFLRQEFKDPQAQTEPCECTDTDFECDFNFVKSGDGTECMKKGDLIVPDGECKAFGAPALLRLPLRIQVTWQDDNTLRMDTDTGTQTRVFRFGAGTMPAGEPNWQGNSVAQWELGAGAGRGGPTRGAALPRATGAGTLARARPARPSLPAGVGSR